MIHGDPPVFSCTFETDKYSDTLFGAYNIGLPPSIEKAVTKRKSEFFAGRFSAKRLLAMIGAESTEVGMSPNRSPLWPSNVVGSITHTNKIAICSAGLLDNYVAIGIDAEDFLRKDTAEEIVHNIVSIQELERLLVVSSSMPEALTLAFSAKESLFKALNPTTKEFFDFADVELTFVDVENRIFELRLLRSLAQFWQTGHTFKGTYQKMPFGFFTQIVLNHF